MGPRKVHEVYQQHPKKDISHGPILVQRRRRGCGA
jgi:hypothetical protein